MSYLRQVTGLQQVPVDTLTDRLGSRTGTEWMNNAACVDRNVWELFHQDPKTSESANAAREVCWTCPVLHECRAWGITNHCDQGVLGGMTQLERQLAAGVRKRDRLDGGVA